MYQKVRVEERAGSVAVMIACGVNPAGTREILAVEPMFDESEDSWRAFFKKLKRRGMKRTALCVSDTHAGSRPRSGRNGWGPPGSAARFTS